MTSSRERVLTSIEFGTPDQVPKDLGGMLSTSISTFAYPRLVKALGLPPRLPRVVDTGQMLAFLSFWKVIGRHLKSGINEWIDASYKPGYLRRIQKYCPGLTLMDMTPYPAGIRAQVVGKDGSLFHDFLFSETPRSLHVCNAPSPAATSAIPIGEHLCDRAQAKFNL